MLLTNSNFLGYWDVGDPTSTCRKCKAIMWELEKSSTNPQIKEPLFTQCCGNGKITLPMLTKPPEILTKLYSNNDAISKHFLANIRAYNMMFSFTSMGGKIDKSVNQGRGPYSFTLHGQNYHRIGSLLPDDGSTPKFAQLYIYDTDHEVQNRIASFRFVPPTFNNI